MSLSSTIAHDGIAPARHFSPRGMRMMAVGFALVIAAGFVVINSPKAEESSGTETATAAGLAYEDFLRLNTTALDGLGPVAPAAETKPQSETDRLIYMNTTALDYLPHRSLEPSSGPR